MRTQVRTAVLMLAMGGVAIGLTTVPGGGGAAPNAMDRRCGGCPSPLTASLTRFELFGSPVGASEIGAEVGARKRGTVYASSNFDEDDEGWRFDDGSVKTPTIVPGGGAGRGGGHLQATTEGLDPVWIAPPSFLGDKRETCLLGR